MPRPGEPALGAGESSSVPGTAAIANAIFDATGVRFRAPPFTPETVREALNMPPALVPHAQVAINNIVDRKLLHVDQAHTPGQTNETAQAGLAALVATMVPAVPAVPTRPTLQTPPILPPILSSILPSIARRRHRPSCNTPLALTSNLHSDRPDNLLQVILNGIQEPAGKDIGFMPAFKYSLSDAQTAELASFMRQRYAPGKAAWRDLPEAVARVRAFR